MINGNARKLVEALRSGRFQQGRSALTFKSGAGQEYDCCLGVACKVYIEEGNKLVVATSSTGNECIVYDGQRNYLPEAVQKWLGFRTASGEFRPPSMVMNSLAGLNDRGASFEKIAAIIESAPPGLFTSPNPPLEP
jgi:hypothetical protein